MPDSRLRKRPAQARSRLTVDAILEAADRILRRDGYAAASTNRIAQVAGFSIGSLYQYFDDKQAVLGALIDRELEREAQTLAEAADAHAAEAPRQLVAGVVGPLLERRGSQRHLYRALVQHADELADDDALAHLVRIESPLAADAFQRALASRAGVCGRRLDAVAHALGCWIHAVALRWAAEETAHVSRDALLAEIGRVAEAFVAGVPEVSPEAQRWLARWVERARCRSGPPAHLQVLQDARAHLLEHAADGAPDLEARAVAASGLVELLWQAHGRGASADGPAGLLEEAARLGEAVLAPAASAGPLPRMA